MCSIISNLYNFDYKDLLNNLKIYNTEHPRLKRILNQVTLMLYMNIKINYL